MRLEHIHPSSQWYVFIKHTPPVCLLFVYAITIVSCSSTPARNVDTIVFGQSESCIWSFDPQGVD